MQVVPPGEGQHDAIGKVAGGPVVLEDQLVPNVLFTELDPVAQSLTGGPEQTPNAVAADVTGNPSHGRRGASLIDAGV